MITHVAFIIDVNHASSLSSWWTHAFNVRALKTRMCDFAIYNRQHVFVEGPCAFIQHSAYLLN